MRSHSLMQGLLKPFPDETLSSWLSRNATSPYVGHMHSEFLSCWQGTAKAGLDGDVDRLYEHQRFMSVFPKKDHQALVGTFSLSNKTSQISSSLNYCPQCLAHDVVNMHAPGWRKAWRIRGNCFCEAHDYLVLLQRLPINSKDQYGKAWLAFSQHAGTGKFSFGNHFIERLTSCSDSGQVEQRLCRIVLRVVRWVSSAPEQPTYSRPSKKCLEFLLGFFLYRPFDRCKGGVGQWFWSTKQTNMHESIRSFRPPSLSELTTGVEMSLPRNLAISYLFIGCAYGLLSFRDIEFINRVLYFTNSPFPQTSAELRALACCFQVGHLLDFKRSATRNLYAGDIPHLQWLFG